MSCLSVVEIINFVVGNDKGVMCPHVEAGGPPNKQARNTVMGDVFSFLGDFSSVVCLILYFWDRYSDNKE